MIKEYFNSISIKYDLVNSIISFGMDNKWRKKAINIAKIKENNKCLDLCCGTGKISKLIKYPNIELYGIDISENMISIAKKEIKNATFFLGDATKLPFNNEYFDVVITGWGLRNINNLEKAIDEIYRVLKNGGRFVSLDMGKPKNIIIKNLFWFYMKHIVPIIGKLFTNNYDSYKYFYESSKNFLSPEELINIFVEKGFSNPQIYNLSFGAVSIIYLEKKHPQK